MKDSSDAFRSAHLQDEFELHAAIGWLRHISGFYCGFPYFSVSVSGAPWLCRRIQRSCRATASSRITSWGEPRLLRCPRNQFALEVQPPTLLSALLPRPSVSM